MAADGPREGVDSLVGAAVTSLPDDRRRAAGEHLGVAVENIASVARSLTSLLMPVPWLISGASSVARTIVERLVRVPAGRRRLPDAKLLAAGASRHVMAETPVRELYLGLLATAVDEDSCAEIHPSFPALIREMTPVDAHLLTLFGEPETTAPGGPPRSVALEIKGDHLAVAVDNLARMNLIRVERIKSGEAIGWLPGQTAPTATAVDGSIVVYRDPRLALEDLHLSLTLSDLGRRFVAVCRQPASGAPTRRS